MILDTVLELREKPTYGSIKPIEEDTYETSPAER
jgi:hypothetical protein